MKYLQKHPHKKRKHLHRKQNNSIESNSVTGSIERRRFGAKCQKGPLASCQKQLRRKSFLP
jgi:hypothetical protein